MIDIFDSKRKAFYEIKIIRYYYYWKNEHSIFKITFAFRVSIYTSGRGVKKSENKPELIRHIAFKFDSRIHYRI